MFSSSQRWKNLLPKDNEVLIRVYATPVSYGDLAARNFKNISAREFHMPLPLLLASRMYLWFQKTKNKYPGE